MKRWLRFVCLASFVTWLTLRPAAFSGQGDEQWDTSFGVPGANGYGLGAAAWSRGALYVGGTFNSVGGRSATNIAMWDGTNWHSMGEGLSGGLLSHVRQLAEYHGRVVAAGFFLMAGNVLATNIAQWDGTNWWPLGEGINGVVSALGSDTSNLYAGGRFTSAGGVAATNVARWDGTNWSALGAGIIPVSEGGSLVGAVDCLVVSGSNVYVGGRFRNAGGVFSTNIARWDGGNWHALGNGLRYFNGPGSENGAVRALAEVNGLIYAGGEFKLAGSLLATNIACWGANGWQAVGGGVGDGLSVLAMAVSGRDMFAAGSFDQIGGIKASRVARWDGTIWSALGAGLCCDGARALASSGTDLVAAGSFASAGGKPSTNIALWHIPHSLSITRTQAQVQVRWPSTGTNFLLEATADASGTNWSEVQQTPLVQDAECVVSEPMETPRKFYRLRRRPW